MEETVGVNGLRCLREDKPMSEPFTTPGDIGSVSGTSHAYPRTGHVPPRAVLGALS